MLHTLISGANFTGQAFHLADPSKIQEWVLL